MSGTASAQSANAYLRTKVLTASREELRLMLLDGALKFCRQAREALTAKDFEANFSALSQCRNIIVELMTTINPDPNPTLAEQVRALYAFMYRELSEAQLSRDPARYDNVLNLLAYERETWVMLMERLHAERGHATPAPAATVAMNAADHPAPARAHEAADRLPFTASA